MEDVSTTIEVAWFNTGSPNKTTYLQGPQHVAIYLYLDEVTWTTLQWWRWNKLHQLKTDGYETTGVCVCVCACMHVCVSGWKMHNRLLQPIYLYATQERISPDTWYQHEHVHAIRLSSQQRRRRCFIEQFHEWLFQQLQTIMVSPITTWCDIALHSWTWLHLSMQGLNSKYLEECNIHACYQPPPN